MSHTLADDSEVVFDQPEESAGAMEPEGSLQNRHRKEISHQPLAMGPLGTEGIHAVNDSDRPTAGGPVGRLFSLDPMGPSGMSSSGDGN